MLDSAPQPDAWLRILPSHGGQSHNDARFCAGAPELAVEICLTSTEVDFGPKLMLYRRAGVREYITIELLFRRIVWRVLVDDAYFRQEMPEDGILRSFVFPGLWLNAAAFWEDDAAKMQASLDAGMGGEEHARFVESLARAAAERAR
jgi:Uma2 family endonuclease